MLAFCCGDNDVAFLEGDSLHDGQGDVLFSTAVGNGEELGVVGHSGGAGHEQQGCQNVLCLHLLYCLMVCDLLYSYAVNGSG